MYAQMKIAGFKRIQMGIREIMKSRVKKIAVFLGLCGLAAGCASRGYEVIETPVDPFPRSTAEIQSVPLRNGNYITRLQSETRKAIVTPYGMKQITDYGDFYRRLRIIEKFDPSEITESNQESFDTVTCRGRKNSGIGKFISALIKLEKNTIYMLTVSVSKPEAGGQNYFVQNFPVLTFARTNGKKCAIKVNELPITPLISPGRVSELQIDIDLHYKKSRSLDLNALFGDIAEIAGFFSQDSTDGVVDGASKLVASNINARVNQIIAEYNEDTKASRSFTIPTIVNPNNDNFDTVILSNGKPSYRQGNASVIVPGSSIWIKMDYYPTLFAQCQTHGIASCFEYLSDANILSKKYHGPDESLTLKNISNDNDSAQNGEAYLLRLEKIQRSEETLEEKRAGIEAVCSDMSRDLDFKPNTLLNKIDQAIFRYALLSVATEFETEYKLYTDKCLAVTNANNGSVWQSRLLGLGANGEGKDRFAAPAFTPTPLVVAKNNMKQVSRRFRNPGTPAKIEMFGNGGVLDIHFTPLLRSADGGDLRASTKEGEQAGELLDPIKFVNGPACPIEGVLRGKETGQLFGMLHEVRDEAPGGFYERIKASDSSKKGTIYVPIVVKMAENGSSIANMTFAQNWSEFYDLLGRNKPNDPWSASCMSDLEQEPFDALKNNF